MSDASTLLNVLTAAYLINVGVMLKHTYDEKEEQELSLTELEEELNSFAHTHTHTSLKLAGPRIMTNSEICRSRR